MFGNGLKDFEDDPFFSGFPSHFHLPFMQLEDGGKGQRKRNSKNDRELENYGGLFGSAFENVNKMMSDMHSRMKNFENAPDAHCYTSSMVMSYQNDGKSKPKVTQASTSTRRAPGQVKETRRCYRDSERGIEKMAVGHHLGGKGHEIEKRRQRGGDIEEERRFYGIDESELPEFEGEWNKRTSSYGVSNRPRGRINNERMSRHREIEQRPTGPARSGRQRK